MSRTPDIEGLLEEMFPASEWAAFRELRADTGYGHEGRIDFAAFRMWSSKGGRRTVAVEVKRSRSDFVREIANPDKRAWYEQQFGECYFAVPYGLVSVDEVPDGWGLFVVTKNGSKLRRKKAARQRSNPEIDAGLTRSILRRCANVEAEYQAVLRDGHGPGKCVPESERKRYEDSLDVASYLARRAELQARDAQAPLHRLAYLAFEHGITEWSCRMVDELVDEAVRRQLSNRMRLMKRAKNALDALIGTAENLDES